MNIEAVETQQHEVTANLIFSKDGLDPFFAADSAVKEGGGSKTRNLQLGEDQWRVTLYYQDSGIAHPGDSLPNGTPFSLDTIREYRIEARCIDRVEEKKINFHLAPRWQEMESENGNKIPVPNGIETAVNVRASGANVETARYPEILRNAAGVVDINAHYFRADSIHPFSNITDAARYVRLHTDESGPVHARDGPIAAMGHLLENDRTGYREIEQADSDEQGRDLPGYRHKTILGPDRIEEMTPQYRIPKEIKHYYTQEAVEMSEDNPLKHPKLEVAYQSSRWDDTIRWRDYEQMNEELEQTLYAVLKEAGLSLSDPENDGDEPGNGPLFVSDQYFNANSSHEVDSVPTLGLDAIEQSQQHVVIKHLSDGLSPVQWESLRTLIADGGTVSPQDIADEHDRHPESVREALRELDGLVERRYADVRLRSDHIANMVHDAVSQAKDAVRNAVETSGKALAAVEEEIADAESALQAFAARHGIDVTSNDGELRVKLRSLGPTATRRDVKEKVRDLLHHWRQAGRAMDRLRYATVEYELDGYRNVATEATDLISRRGTQ